MAVDVEDTGIGVGIAVGMGCGIGTAVAIAMLMLGGCDCIDGGDGKSASGV